MFARSVFSSYFRFLTGAALALAAEGASVHINGRTDTSVQAAIDLIRAAKARAVAVTCWSAPRPVR